MRLLLVLLGRGLIDRFHRDLAAGPQKQTRERTRVRRFFSCHNNITQCVRIRGVFCGGSLGKVQLDEKSTVFVCFVQTACKAFPVDCRIDGFSKGLNQRDNFPPRITRQAPFWFIRHDTSERRATESQSVRECDLEACGNRSGTATSAQKGGSDPVVLPHRWTVEKTAKNSIKCSIQP